MAQVKPTPPVCPTCSDTGVVISPAPLGHTWAHPCPSCGAVRFTAGHVAKLYERQVRRYGEDEAAVWLHCLHRGVESEVLGLARRETAVQMGFTFGD